MWKGIGDCWEIAHERGNCDEGYYYSEGSCVSGIPLSIVSYGDYCVHLGYSNGDCAQNCGRQCVGTCESGGDTSCYSLVNYCCCVH